MNTAIKVLTAGYITPNFKINRISIGVSTFLLLIVLLVSALGLVYVKDLHRRLFIEYQKSQQIHHNAVISQGKLLLEKSSWSAEARIQQVAQKRLAMIMPKITKHIILNNNHQDSR